MSLSSKADVFLGDFSRLILGPFERGVENIIKKIMFKTGLNLVVTDAFVEKVVSPVGMLLVVLALVALYFVLRRRLY